MSRLEIREVLSRLTDEAKDKLGEAYSGNTLWNSAAFSLARSWDNAGGGAESYIEAVTTHTLGQSYPRRDLESRLGKTFDDAVEANDRDAGGLVPGGDVRAALWELYERVQRSSAVDDVLRPSALALIEHAASVPTRKPTATSRQLAVYSGAGHKSVARHMKQFHALGFISGVEWTPGGGGAARRFALNLAWGRGTDDTYTLPRTYMCHSSHPLWTKNGLGPTALKVLGTVPVAATPAAELRKTYQGDRKTFDKYAEALAEHGAVAVVEGGRMAANLLFDPDHAAAALGVVERRESRAAKFKAEAAEWAAKRDLPEYRWRRFAYGDGRAETVAYIRDHCHGLSFLELRAKLARTIGGSVYQWGAALASRNGLKELVEGRHWWPAPTNPGPDPFEDRWPHAPVWPSEENGFYDLSET